MKQGARIAVVGGGIIGISIAWRFGQQGAKVVLFERQVLGAEASWAAAGMLSPGGELDEDTSESEFYLHSRGLYPEFVAEITRESGLPVDYRDCGALDLAYSPAEWDQLQARALRHRALGIQSRPLSPERVQTLSAFVEKNGLQGAIFYPGDGVAAPRDLLPALRSVAASAGVEFREHAEVPSIKCLPNQVEIGGESFSSVVVAAGAWSSALQLSGAPPLPEVRPVKGHLLAFELQLGACPTIIRHRHIYIFQRGNGTVIVGATVENAGFDHSIDPAKARELHLQATAILPVLEKLNPIDLWTGLRPKSEQLRLGWWQDTPVYMAYGHYRNGILLAPATAERAVRDYRTAGYI